MISAFQFMKKLQCCNDCLKKAKVHYATDEETKNNAVIFVSGDVGKRSLDFDIIVRSIPSKGESAENIALALLEMNNSIVTFDSGEQYMMYVDDFVGNSVDDKKRLLITSTIRIKEV